MGQRVAHVTRVAVDEVVLAAVRLVGDDHDVAAVGQRRVAVAFLFGEELVERGEDHAARRHAQQLPQVHAALGLHRRLAQEVLATGEGAEELVVEVVAVCEHDDGRVLHRRLADDAARVEGHRQALARALRVPDHAHATVARLAARLLAGLIATRGLRDPIARAVQLGRAQRLAHRHLHRMELVVAGHLLRDAAAAVVLVDDEVAHQIEEALRGTEPFDHHLQLR